VRDVAQVVWIEETPLADGEKVIVLGSSEPFHFIRETPEGLGPERCTRPTDYQADRAIFESADPIRP